jgi:WD40 repeat protein
MTMERDQRLQDILVGYLEAAERGRAPELAGLQAQYPEFATELAEFFANRAQLDHLAAPLRSAVEAAQAEAAARRTLGLRDNRNVAAPGEKVRYFGDYELLGEIARGGMGVVYRARQVSLNRGVALKMILAGELATEAQMLRFRKEAEAAAQLDHANIVPIFEVGEHDGQHYFSMKLVEGVNLSQRIAELQHDRRAAARLLMTVTRAAAYAHRRGIVHRDLKPSNILIDGQGQPHVTDFGLAKQLDSTEGPTHTGAVLGTPSYMAPEQAAGQVRQVGVAADIYALGAILYELLTGRPPFRGESPMDILLQVMSDDPVAPRLLDPGIPKDLETICLKCLEKQPKRRYPTAQALADDLGRFGAGEPIQARPVSRLERIVKWAKRRPAAAALIAVSALASVLLVTGLAVGILLIADKQSQTETALGREKHAKDEVDKAYQSERQTSYLQRISLARAEWLANHVNRAEEILDECQPESLRDWEWHYLKRLCHAEQRTFRQAFHGFTADGRIALAGPNGTIRICDLATDQETATLLANGTSLAFGPDGMRAVLDGGTEGVKILDARTSKVLRVLKDLRTDSATCKALSPDGKRLALGGGGHSVRVWDLDTGQQLFSSASSGPFFPAWALAFRADSKLLASGGRDGSVRVWDPASGKQLHEFPGPFPDGWIKSVALSPDGRFVAAASNELLDQQSSTWLGDVKVWDLSSKQLLHTLKGHRGEVIDVTFSPDGQRLASTSDDQSVRVWEVKTGREIFTLRGADHWAAYSPDGKHLATGNWDGTVKVWDALQGQGPRIFGRHHSLWSQITFSPDGYRLAEVSNGWTNDRPRGGVKIWEVATARELRDLAADVGPVNDVAFSPDGLLVAAADADPKGKPRIVIWNSHTGQEVLAIPGPWTGFAFSPDSRWLAAGGDTSLKDSTAEVRFFDTATGKAVFSLKGHPDRVGSMAFSPDGRLLATSGGGAHDFEKQRYLPAEVKIWDLAGRQEIFSLKGHTGPISTVAFSPDGQRLATAGNERMVRMWDPATGRELWNVRHAQRVNNVSFSRSGQRLAGGSADGSVKIWSTATGREVLDVDRFVGFNSYAIFSPDGQRLAASGGRTLKVWDAMTLR